MDRVNDFAFKIATANGTGSASANGLIMQAIFRMGVPVTGKNVFPSNIQGLPTWYEIRVNKDGYTARTPHFDLMVALNAATYQKDVAEVRAGGYLLYDSTWPLDDRLHRPDVTYLGVPLAEMCNAAFKGVRERILMKNIAYAGALAALLEMDADIIRQLLKDTFGRKPALMDSNQTAVDLGYDYAKKTFPCPLPMHLQRMDKTKDAILIDGNTAAALGCVYAGATVAAWYPITPSTSLMDAFRGFCQKFRVTDQGKHKFAIIQAEDELAAIGMVIGASWAGARAFTSTAGPGISLMNEFIGLAYYAEIPAVLFDVQRTGPSTGMPTRTQQGDLMECAYASHGDTRHICLYPADPREAFEFAAKSFDLAERFQTPVFVLTDLDIGMNDWMISKLTWDDSYRPDRGKVLSAEQLEQAKSFYRYLDVDGDGIPYRTLPGTHPKGAYFTRGSGHNKFGGYTEDSDEYTELVDRLDRKIQGAAKAVPKPIIQAKPGHKLGLVTIGGCHAACVEAMDVLAREGIVVDYMRVRGFPFSDEVTAFLEAHDINFIVEQNRDAQLRSLLMLETGVPIEKLASVRYYGGFPMSAHHVITGVKAKLEKAA
ncbi:MAG TPA: 2-oxoacid:acceptor oxidoreductase subunit alpha [Vicinamibacterales bacterium]|jgi:2-oxoglutarate ferredoxin oxidoreductase subunit alpha|nr:2-oxoacid:acceptor oxidoreductase subunit alpha [Vicinamibacterales bacterium]